MDIIAYLSEGKENAKTRQELCKLTGLSDRELRRVIEHERLKYDRRICSSSQTSGYWKPKHSDDILHPLFEVKKRIKSLKALESYYERIMYQMECEERSKK